MRWWAFALICAQAIPLIWLVFIADGWTVNRLVVRIWSDVQNMGLLTNVSPEGMDGILNTVMLLPTALFASLWLPRVHVCLIALGGALISAAIELTQLLILAGRDASWFDLAFNSLGAVIGAALGYSINRWLRWRAKTR